MIDVGLGIIELDLGTLLLLISLVALVLDYLFIIFGEYVEKWEIYSEIALVTGSTLLTIAFLYFSYSILTADYSFETVYLYVSNDMDFVMRLSAIWSGRAGSFFFWSFLGLICYLIFRILFRDSAHETILWRAFVFTSAQVSALVALTLLNEPFKPVDLPANIPLPITDGQGLNPLLMTIWNVIHPPVIFVGYVLCLVPTAIAITKITLLDDGKTPKFESKEKLTKFLEFNVSLAWFVLSSGIILGGYWAYITLGWGGFWAWDPVETGSLIPWLFLTLYYHGKPFYRKNEYLGNYIISMTYTATLFATFITRSNIINTVHGFNPTDSNIPILGEILAFFLPSLEADEGITLLLGVLLTTFLLPHAFGIRNKGLLNIDLGLDRDDFQASRSKTTALKISFLAGLIGTYVIIGGLIAPVGYDFIGNLFPVVYDEYGPQMTVDMNFYNTVMTIFGGIMLIAGFFCTFFANMNIRKRLGFIFGGLVAGGAFVVGGWGGVEYTLNEENLTPEFLNTVWSTSDTILFLFEDFWTTGDKANFAIPLIFLALVGVTINFGRVLAFETKHLFRKTGQTMLHLSFLLIMLGALLSANSITTWSGIVQGGGEYQVEGTTITLEVIRIEDTIPESERTLKEYNIEFLLKSGNSIVGAGVTRLSIDQIWGYDRKVTIISSLWTDYYIVTQDAGTNQYGTNLALVQVKVVPYINILWAGCIILHVALLPLVIQRLLDFKASSEVMKNEAEKAEDITKSEDIEEENSNNSI